MARLDLQDLCFSVGALEILRHVDLSVEDGKCLALLGPSGCGKSTTLRCIAGFVRPTGGSISFDGQSVLGLPPHRRNVGLVFQDYALFPHMNVAENIAYGLRRRGVPAAERGARVAEALALVRLDDFGDRMPGQLSGGQQQRVALARALVIRPSLLLLDEPLGALDRRLRDQMQVELKRIQREAGITTIIVTHDQEEALSLSDRVAVMSEGRITETGRPGALYRRPGSREVMEFLGVSNLLAGRVEHAAAGQIRVRVGPSLALRAAGAAAAGSAVHLGIRPESFAMVAAPSSGEGGANTFLGQVTESVYKGSHVELYVQGPDGLRIIVQQRGEALAGAAPEIGQQVALTIDPEAIVVFE
ncbi:MAG: Fe3+/spermidine/putrescine ABC transporter ATP-binding protein [Alphaproteobacteria bacterium HGW-Alphaproteobacteria-2]|nr:MAG: Fe3+/spermidine/putrescine ABC transporter ATP-binding protein [Alphaproteobacteria bacterium HGW-Alphaproteobacteria-2]